VECCGLCLAVSIKLIKSRSFGGLLGSLVDLVVQDGTFADEDAKLIAPLVRGLKSELGDKVAHLSFQANVRNQAIAGVPCTPRHVAGVWVAVRVAIGHVEEDQDVVAVNWHEITSVEFEVVTQGWHD